MKKIPCEVYSRVVGYFRPIQTWNKGKKEEFKNRLPLKVDRYQIEQMQKEGNHG